ncbi:hypothetical protein HGRIS_000646 [Hohenbuehelia grisea]|uniref:DUF6533 domain-containing protein n=1 Tax=Hohenbuehelia grisea TaxID=104357 RepID=A0ABR3JRL7_9AGAR
MDVDSKAPPLALVAEHLMAAKMFSLASCVMLFYDIVLTFGDEVEYIWKKKFTPVTLLWFMNRYLSPLGYVVIIVSFHDPWPESRCHRYVLYPEALKLFTSLAIGIIFILRLYAIYARNRIIIVCASLLLAGELAVKTWAFTDGTNLPLPHPLVGCILVGKSAPGARFVYTWIVELLFDTTIFVGTLSRTIYLYQQTRYSRGSTLVELIMRDGIIYFAVIFVANLVTVLIFILAPDDIKAVNASFSTLITSLMVSRLMLNLRGVMDHDQPRTPRKQSRNVYPMQEVMVETTTTTQWMKDDATLNPSSCGVENTTITEVDREELRPKPDSQWFPPPEWKLDKHVNLGAIV